MPGSLPPVIPLINATETDMHNRSLHHELKDGARAKASVAGYLHWQLLQHGRTPERFQPRR